MTPQEILALSEPVEQVYTDVVAQLVSNICRHLGQGKELSTQQWEIKKLSELDALTNESIKIIQNASGKSRAEIKRAIAEAMGVGVRDVEKVLKGAERAGAIAGIGFTAEQSDALKNLLESLVNQAEDRANLVNTVMLNSTRNRYVWAVNNTATEEQKLIEKLLSARNAEELERQLGKVQTALNVATSSVEVGAESRVQALSRTVKQLAQEGITGYIDAGGHHWSPEAYMNMDIRTTVHNAYVQAQKERAAEYNVSTFQITSHAGARPLCAPYQGKFYSWDGSDGVLEDLHGNKHVYESIHATSYGQPAGIFGINCGHDPVTFVNGYSIPRYEPTQDAEQNAKEYAESQKQRQLERNVRQAKLEAIAQDAAGNKEAFKTAAEKVRQANADYKAYCKETGRTPRNDRLQVYASPDGQGYNRSMSGKVTGTTRGWKPPETTPPTPKKEVQKFVPASTIQEAEQAFSKAFDKNRFGAIGVSYSGVSVDVANTVNKTVLGMYDKYNVAPFGGIQAPAGNTKLGKQMENATAAYSPVRHSFLINRKTMATMQSAEKAFAAERNAITDILQHPEKYDLSKARATVREVIERSKVSGRATVPTTIEEALMHEFGHALEKQVKQNPSWSVAKANMGTFADRISGYAGASESEYIAESFASYEKGENLCDPLMVQIFKSLLR